MPLLFSYGSLQEEKVQLSTFGRLLHGGPDELLGFEPSLVRIDDPQVAAALGKTHHANVVSTARDDNRVAGMVFEVTEAELTSVDAYELEFAYGRVEAMLASGRRTWVYRWTPPGTR